MLKDIIHSSLFNQMAVLHHQHIMRYLPYKRQIMGYKQYGHFSFFINLLQQFDAWLKAEGMQVIATRVSTGDECQIIIEDGLIKEPEPPKFATPMKGWMK